MAGPLFWGPKHTEAEEGGDMSKGDKADHWGIPEDKERSPVADPWWSRLTWRQVIIESLLVLAITLACFAILFAVLVLGVYQGEFGGIR